MADRHSGLIDLRKGLGTALFQPVLLATPSNRFQLDIMTANLTVMEGAYLQDVLDQPRAIRDTTAALRTSHELNEFVKGLSPGRYRRIVLTGMGGSFHILSPLYLDLVAQGFPVVMAETSELIHFMSPILSGSTLLVVVSQSGRSAEIIRLLDRDGERPTILGVTNDATSPLARKADVVALIQAGPEASVSCKTTTASLAALAWIGDGMSGTDLHRTTEHLELAARFVEDYLALWRTHVEALGRELQGVLHLFVTGRGSSFAAAGVGGMIMKEAAHFHAEGLGSAAFRHGPFEMLNADCLVVVLAGDASIEPLHKKLVEDVRQTGARALLVGTHTEFQACRLADMSNKVRPIEEMIPLQMISLALAAIRGREAGKFDRIGKVTTSE